MNIAKETAKIAGAKGVLSKFISDVERVSFPNKGKVVTNLKTAIYYINQALGYLGRRTDQEEGEKE